jgi:RNA polymerase sigma-70 factor (family 1)
MKASELFSIKQINEKDAAAFHLLYTHYYKILTYYSSQIVDSMESAEDIVQDLFSSIWEKNLQFKTEESFLSYLYNSIRNSSINYLRHKNVEDAYIEKMMEKYELHPNEEEDEELFEPEVYKRLFQLIDTLPPRCREIFLMHIDGKKNEEIADILQLSVSTVKTQKKRAMAVLKKSMTSYNYFLLLMMLTH